MIKQFKNGIHIKKNPDANYDSMILYLYEMEGIYPVSYEYALGNSCGAALWSYNGGYGYIEISDIDLQRLADGKTIILPFIGNISEYPLYEDMEGII